MKRAFPNLGLDALNQDRIAVPALRATSFGRSSLDRAPTSPVAEGLNSKIMAIKRKACGYRNRDHFKTAIYFFCGGLDLYPTSS